MTEHDVNVATEVPMNKPIRKENYTIQILPFCVRQFTCQVAHTSNIVYTDFI